MQFLHVANVLDVPSGTIKYKGAKIQLLDLPGIIEGAKDGKGRGRQARFSSGVPAVIESTEREAGGWARRHGLVWFTRGAIGERAAHRRCFAGEWAGSAQRAVLLMTIQEMFAIV